MGEHPTALAYNPINNKIYCANEESDNVSIIDGAGDTVMTTVAVEDWPGALVCNPKYNKIYCTNVNSYKVTIIDGAGDTVMATLGMGDLPWALACNSQNNNIYCAKWNNNVTVIDGKGDSVITTVGVGSDPEALVYNPQNNRIYCANYGDSSVSVIACSPPTAVEEDQETQVITDFSLKQNYPNPFNPTTRIQFTVGSRQRKAADGGLVLSKVEGQSTADGSLPHTTLTIYNILGRKVRTLVNEPKRAGTHEVIWDGKDDKGKKVASGIYLYQLNAGIFTETRKMLLLK